MRYFKIATILVISAGSLAACGDTPLEQGVLGAGAGAGAAIVTGGNAKTAAVIGGLGNLAYCQTYPSRCN
ncbi:MAG: hypothetical protein ACRBBO_11765 [Cognatishimia sp.]|uniref:hypothetical protein n=1 Tax=Cognatishimia sp. 1_MG-2023 TaxID=3062642 RepID=UPI0026E31795|nr:hypothetical protein [Cognatishimia sp. 1_MG-2023]MDO6726716.1 hypothetical protein [Cognatishimia sp. 1_MG-2023]